MSLSMLDAAVPSGSLAALVAGPGGIRLQDVRRQSYLSRSVPFRRRRTTFRLQAAVAAGDRRGGSPGRHGFDYPRTCRSSRSGRRADHRPQQPRLPLCRARGLHAGVDRGGRRARSFASSSNRTAATICDGVVIHTAPADHGDFSASALCLVLEVDGIRVFCTGDTAFRPNLHKPLADLQPDVLLACINGVFGNMNHIDAAMLVQSVKPRYAIPCHFWTFAEQGGGDPAGFVHACKHYCPETKPLLLRPGERFLCQKQPT